MKKIILTLAMAITLTVSGFAFAADSVIDDWANQIGLANQASTAAASQLAGGVVWSRHNLSSYGEHYQATTSVLTTVDSEKAFQAQTVITTEICVFCHTPHFGRTDTAPLWNRGTSMTGFTAYGSTLANKSASATGVSGSSLACLSCHDGVTTFDNLINKPGKGSNTNAKGNDQGWIFGEIGPGDTIGDSYADGTKKASRLNIGAGTDEVRDAADVDLRNDHPISITYNTNGTAASLRATTTRINSLSMANARHNGDNSARSYYGRADNLWAVYGYLNDGATIADLLRDNNTKVECASCHDPHYKNQTNTDPVVVCSYFSASNADCLEAANASFADPAAGAGAGTSTTSYLTYMQDVDSDGLFLRRVGGNSQSGVCRTCHAK